MGVVYKAVDLKLERTVALKFLPHEIVVSDIDKERLLREARSASALDHPNIGVIHGIEESDDHQLFIVMAYYEGDTLAQKLNRGVLSFANRSTWPFRSPGDSARRTPATSCIATSSLPISSSPKITSPRSWTSASLAWWPPPAPRNPFP